MPTLIMLSQVSDLIQDIQEVTQLCSKRSLTLPVLIRYPTLSNSFPIQSSEQQAMDKGKRRDQHTPCVNCALATVPGSFQICLLWGRGQSSAMTI